jgi:uncharacterized protein YjiS (DUF1127 family)
MRSRTWDQSSRNHAGADRGKRLREIVRAALCVIGGWRERARERRQLAGLSEFQLRDIGLSRAEVEIELMKRFWRP